MMDVDEKCAALEKHNHILRDQLQSAIYRLDDMLVGDDGQAWKEAEKARPAMQRALGETSCGFVDNVEKKHWFAFSYVGDCIETGYRATVSTYTGYPEKNVNRKMIEKNKEYAGVENAALLGVSYLGYMSREMFSGDE